MHPGSFESVKTKACSIHFDWFILYFVLIIFSLHMLQWVPDIQHYCPKTPFLLVGTKIDLLDDLPTLEELLRQNLEPVLLDAAERLARELNAVKYVECSALTRKGSHLR